MVQCTLYGSLKRKLDSQVNTHFQYEMINVLLGGVMESACGRRPPDWKSLLLQFQYSLQ